MDLTGTGRINVFTLLHQWDKRTIPRAGRAIAAYATLHNGTDAIVGLLPRPDLPDGVPDLYTIATSHQPPRKNPTDTKADAAAWLTCTGWSSLITGNSFALTGTWTLTSPRTYPLTGEKGSLYGHHRVHVGILTLPDPHLAQQAHALL